MQLITLSPDDVQRVQRHEGRCYYSASAGTILRQIGFIPSSNSSPLLVTRGVNARLSLPTLYEGPIASNLAEHFGLQCSLAQSASIELIIDRSFAGFEKLPARMSLSYPKFTTREVPDERNEYGPISEFFSSEALANNQLINCQRFMCFPAGYRPIVGFKDGGAAALTDGRSIYLSFALLDLLAADLYYPALERGYYATLAASESSAALALLAALLRSIGAVAVPLWPSDYSSALTVRHDYDRFVTERSLLQLLDFYDEKGIKCTWYTLRRRAPAAQLREIADRGHEIALHTEARTLKEFEEEITVLREMGFGVRGVTAHGGSGAFGFVGQTQYTWIEKAGLSYGEVMDRDIVLPGRVLFLEEGALRQSSVAFPACHLSLDDTTQSQTNPAKILQQIRHRIDSGFHVNLMNHPDLNRNQLISLLGDIDLSRTWRATHNEIVQWTNRSRYT